MSRLRHLLALAGRHRELTILIVLTTLLMSGSTIVTPVLPIYAGTFAASSTMIGLVITLYGVGRLISNLPAGLLSYRFGNKPLLLVACGLMIVASAGAALTGDLTWLLVWRFVQGVSSGIYMTVSAASIAYLADDRMRARIMSLHQSAIFLGAGIGPALGGLVAGLFGITAPFWACAVIGAVALATTCLSRIPKPSADLPGEPETRLGATLAGALIRPLYLALCLVTFVAYFTRTASQFQLVPLIAYEDYDLGLDTIGLALSILALTTFVALPLAGALIDRVGARSVVVGSSLLTALSLVMIAEGHTLVWFWTGMVTLGVAVGFNSPAVMALVTSITPRHLYGPAIGFMRTCGDVGYILGPILVGLVDDWTTWGKPGGLLLNALLAVVGSVLFLPLYRLFRKRG